MHCKNIWSAFHYFAYKYHTLSNYFTDQEVFLASVEKIWEDANYRCKMKGHSPAKITDGDLNKLENDLRSESV